jgi:hypothetical protein
VPGQHTVDVAQVDERDVPVLRPFRHVRQGIRDPGMYRSVGSSRVRRISSLIDSARIVACINFDRANRGLLRRPWATEEAAASRANGTQWRSAFRKRTHLRQSADERCQEAGARTGLVREMEEASADRLFRAMPSVRRAIRELRSWVFAHFCG